jgi:hypothetical protein
MNRITRFSPGQAGRRVLLCAAWGLSLLGLQACTAVPSRLAPGLTRAEVLAQAGKPTAVYPLPQGGERLQYSELPAGVAVHDLDFDAQGRLVSARQVLTTAVLDSIRADQWTVQDVRTLLGAPRRVEHVATFLGDIWTYRFRDNGNDRFFHVFMDQGGTVRKTQYTDDFTSDPNRGRS